MTTLERLAVRILDLEAENKRLRNEHENQCPLVHCNCGACGSEIRVDGTCGCADKRHPVGPHQQTLLGVRADQINELEAEVEQLRSAAEPVEASRAEEPSE